MLGPFHFNWRDPLDFYFYSLQKTIAPDQEFFSIVVINRNGDITEEFHINVEMYNEVKLLNVVGKYEIVILANNNEISVIKLGETLHEDKMFDSPPKLLSEDSVSTCVSQND